MLVNPAPDPPGAVFFDPLGRRRRALTVVLLATVGISAAGTVLLIIGLIGGGHPPRTTLGPGEPRAARVSVGTASYPTARHLPSRRPADLPPPLPALPNP
jgi:hypothetical protein